MRFPNLDLKTKLITSKIIFRMSLPGMVVCKSKIIFRKNLSGMVVYKMFRSKGKVDLAFFDTDLI